IYKDAIGTGKEVNDVSVFSAVQAALKAQSETSNAGNEQIENVVIDEPEKPTDKEKEDKEVEAMTKATMKKSRYGGKK
ncbi:hypothetical protein KAR91_30330, partial [Candidatus Pacearchaeota archaeon]|nr:hypothetical protein [Candidatus Pacearchaeota archaeon]